MQFGSWHKGRERKKHGQIDFQLDFSSGLFSFSSLLVSLFPPLSLLSHPCPPLNSSFDPFFFPLLFIPLFFCLSFLSFPPFHFFYILPYLLSSPSFLTFILCHLFSSSLISSSNNFIPVIPFLYLSLLVFASLPS